MNLIKPEVIHEIHTAVSISEEFFLSMAALHTRPCPKETFATLISDAKLVPRELQLNRIYQGSDRDLQDVSVYVELR